MVAPKNDMVQVVYRSQSVGEVDQMAVYRIRRLSEARNAELGLTGILFLFDSTFVGLLEGPRDVVFERMESISSDPIHTGMTVMREAGITARRFKTWTFQDLRSGDENAFLQATGNLFAQKLSRELYRAT